MPKHLSAAYSSHSGTELCPASGSPPPCGGQRQGPRHSLCLSARVAWESIISLHGLCQLFWNQANAAYLVHGVVQTNLGLLEACCVVRLFSPQSLRAKALQRKRLLTASGRPAQVCCYINQTRQQLLQSVPRFWKATEVGCILRG